MVLQQGGKGENVLKEVGNLLSFSPRYLLSNCSMLSSRIQSLFCKTKLDKRISKGSSNSKFLLYCITKQIFIEYWLCAMWTSVRVGEIACIMEPHTIFTIACNLMDLRLILTHPEASSEYRHNSQDKILFGFLFLL